MKKLTLIASAATLLAANTALAFDYGDSVSPPRGTALFQHHAVTVLTEAGECLSGGAVCAGAGSINSELSAAITITNVNPCNGGTPGVCTEVGVSGNYVGAASVPSAGATPTSPVSSLHSPECDLGTLPCAYDLPLTTAFWDWNLTTDASGMIVDGFAVVDSSFQTQGTVGVFIWPEKIFRSYRGTAATLDAACTLAASDPQTCATDPANTPASAGDFEYITVPMGQEGSAKAVPVPAFAAAALGLGLIGVTVASSRRRKLA